MTIVLKKKSEPRVKQSSLFEGEEPEPINSNIETPEHPADCNKCEMRNYANRVVWGVGSNKEIVLIGEAPGQEEDNGGKPFIGASGKLVREAIGNLDPYITNCVKCRPPNNRQPAKEEVLACSRYYIPDELKDAKIVVLLGLTAQHLRTLYPESFKGKMVIEKPHPAHALYKHYKEEWIASFQNELRYSILMTFDTLTAYKMNQLISEEGLL